MASRPGMAERTISLRSLGKTFSLTGWKIGWAVAPPHLTAGIRSAHQFFTFAVSTPFQHATIAALEAPQSYFDTFTSEYRARRDLLCGALDDVGFDVFTPAGTYFVLADHTPFGYDDVVLPAWPARGRRRHPQRLLPRSRRGGDLVDSHSQVDPVLERDRPPSA